jgi:hypothetical protein
VCHSPSWSAHGGKRLKRQVARSAPMNKIDAPDRVHQLDPRLRATRHGS